MVDYHKKYNKYKSKYLNLKKLIGGMDANLTDSPSSSLSLPVEIDPVREIVDYMLDKCAPILMKCMILKMIVGQLKVLWGTQEKMVEEV